jgi:hypothetical protein
LSNCMMISLAQTSRVIGPRRVYTEDERRQLLRRAMLVVRR